MKPNPSTLSPFEALEAVLDFPGDPLTASMLADILGMHRNTISEAMSSGRIESQGLKCRRAGERNKRWSANKSAVIAWLWCNTSGSKLMMRATLAARAPRILAILERADAEAAAIEAQKMVPIFGAPAPRAMRQEPPPPSKEEQSFFAFALAR
jgi:hypothetical protein